MNRNTMDSGQPTPQQVPPSSHTADTRPRLRKWHLPFLLMLAVGSYLAITHKLSQQTPYQRHEGTIFGTVFHTTYQSDTLLTSDILAVLHDVDRSLSMFNPQSTISQINSSRSDRTDSLLEQVMEIATTVSKDTEGAFDVTVAPLVNAWGFGFKHGIRPDSLQVDSLRALVGWQRVGIVNHRFVKDDPAMVVDLSAVAKGFATDRVAALFASKGIRNYMIEIGGEIVARGVNPKNQPWRIGVNKPDDDSTSTNNELQTILRTNDCALATSGNYRNYYIAEGRKIAHTIDPRTGYPVQHSILSSTVVAPDCATADAYATAFMVLGLDKAREVLARNPKLKAYFIYDTPQGYRVWMSEALKKDIDQQSAHSIH